MYPFTVRIMKVTSAMIDPQLRSLGMLMRVFFRPSLRFFKLINKLSQRLSGANIQGYDCSEIFIPSRDLERDIRVRKYKPWGSKEKNLPVVLYLHGGGYAINVPESDHKMIQRILDSTPCVVIAPDYRRSLEHPFPSGIEDCYDTAEWINSEFLENQNQCFIIAGTSAGGGLAVALTLWLRKSTKIRVTMVIPIYPMLDHRMQTKSMINNNAPVWSVAHNKLAWSLYLKGIKDIPILASPALNSDWVGFPPTITYVGELDPFRDETINFCLALEDAGVSVTYRVFTGAYHAFDILVENAEISISAKSFLAESIEREVKKLC